jgi:hypothetical protein
LPSPSQTIVLAFVDDSVTTRDLPAFLLRRNREGAERSAVAQVIRAFQQMAQKADETATAAVGSGRAVAWHHTVHPRWAIRAQQVGTAGSEAAPRPNPRQRPRPARRRRAGKKWTTADGGRGRG